MQFSVGLVYDKRYHSFFGRKGVRKMEWITLSSRQNPAVKLCASLADKKAREKSGLFPAEGETLLFDFAQNGLYPEMLFLSTDAALSPKQIEETIPKTTVLYSVLPHVFEKMTTEKGSQGVLALYSQKKLAQILPTPQKGFFMALECVQDPGNLGTVLRTACALGFDGVFLVGGADPFSPKAVRASMGALAKIPLQTFSSTADLFDHLEENRIRSVATCLSSDSVPVLETDLSAPLCILVGNEGKGLSELAKQRATFRSIVPIEKMESLNAAVAASLFMWECKRRENR